MNNHYRDVSLKEDEFRTKEKPITKRMASMSSGAKMNIYFCPTTSVKFLFCSILLDILHGGHQLPRALARGLGSPLWLGFSHSLNFQARALAQCH